MVLLSTSCVLSSLRKALVLNELRGLASALRPQGLWPMSVPAGTLESWARYVVPRCLPRATFFRLWALLWWACVRFQVLSKRDSKQNKQYVFNSQRRNHNTFLSLRKNSPKLVNLWPFFLILFIMWPWSFFRPSLCLAPITASLKLSSEWNCEPFWS